jgi:hypothetical protein
MTYWSQKMAEYPVFKPDIAEIATHNELAIYILNICAELFNK